MTQTSIPSPPSYKPVSHARAFLTLLCHMYTLTLVIFFFMHACLGLADQLITQYFRQDKSGYSKLPFRLTLAKNLGILYTVNSLSVPCCSDLHNYSFPFQINWSSAEASPQLVLASGQGDGIPGVTDICSPKPGSKKLHVCLQPIL